MVIAIPIPACKPLPIENVKILQFHSALLFLEMDGASRTVCGRTLGVDCSRVRISSSGEKSTTTNKQERTPETSRISWTAGKDAEAGASLLVIGTRSKKAEQRLSYPSI
jgi:hypothetical protein